MYIKSDSSRIQMYIESDSNRVYWLFTCWVHQILFDISGAMSAGTADYVPSLLFYVQNQQFIVLDYLIAQ